MIRFILRRLGFVAATILVSSALIFIATQVLPGDVARMILGRFATDEAVQNLRAELGLDRPLIVQYASWLFNFVQGDWGQSLSTGDPVMGLVFSRLRNSAMLAAVAFVIYVPFGILLGLWAALRRNTATDQIISIGSLSFIGLPEFVTGVILISIFAIKLRWLPASSAIVPDASFIEALPRLILPGITVALVSLAYITRMTRSSTIDVLQTDYVRTAYLKGLRPRKVLFGHVLRNALLPTVTVAAISIGWLIGGRIVTESP
ncbi:MAG: ABC transporter permease, partial [Desulfococcaceae bacterium]